MAGRISDGLAVMHRYPSGQVRYNGAEYIG